MDATNHTNGHAHAWHVWGRNSSAEPFQRLFTADSFDGTRPWLAENMTQWRQITVRCDDVDPNAGRDTDAEALADELRELGTMTFRLVGASVLNVPAGAADMAFLLNQARECREVLGHLLDAVESLDAAAHLGGEGRDHA